MSVRIAEIDAAAATRPVSATLYRDSVLLQPLRPGRQLLSGDSESNVHRPIAIMRRDGAARQFDRGGGGAAPEQQKNAAIGGVVSAQPAVGKQRPQFHHRL